MALRRVCLSQLLVSSPGTLLEVADDASGSGALPDIDTRAAEPFLEVDQANRDVLCVTWASDWRSTPSAYSC